MRPPVLGRGPVQCPVHRGPPQIQVDVVLPGDADAAVQLHAVLHDVGGALARRRTWPRSPARGVGGRRAATAVAAAAAVAWQASSHSFMSANRCLSAW